MPLPTTGLSLVPDFPSSPEGYDALWVALSAVEDTNRWVNKSQLSVMELGTGTLQAPVAGIANRIGRLVTIGSQEPVGGNILALEDARAMYLAIALGVTLGKKIAHDSNKLHGEPADVVSPRLKTRRGQVILPKLGSALDGVSIQSPAGAATLFERVRDLELAETNADVLAFSTLAIQDHLRSEYQNEKFRTLSGQYGQLNDEIEPRLGLVYLGEFAGAYLNISSSRLLQARKQGRTELMGSMQTHENLAS